MTLDLGDPLDGALEGVLEGDDAVGVESQGLDRLDVEGVGEVGGPELDAAEALLGGAGLGEGAAPVAGDEAEGEAFVALGAPLGVDVDQPGGGDVAQVEQHAFAGAGVGLTDALAEGIDSLVGLAGVHREVGADVVAAGDALLLFAGDAVDLVGAGFGHLDEVVQDLAVGVVAQAGAGEGAELQPLLLAGEEVAGLLADDGVAEGANSGVLHHELGDAVLLAVVVDEVHRPESRRAMARGREMNSPLLSAVRRKRRSGRRVKL